MARKWTKRNRPAVLVTAVLSLTLVAGLTTSASGDPVAHAAGLKKCLKKAKQISDPDKRKKAKKRCRAKFGGIAVPTPAPTPAPGQTLIISPASFTFPNTQHGAGQSFADFVVTNTGGSASGVPTVSIVDVLDPVALDDPAFTVSANTCTAAVPAGGTCGVTVRFSPQSNGGDANYTAVLHVAASPGGDAQAGLGGHAD
jgi:hypothetical protein